MELSSPRLLSLGSGDCGGGLLAVGRRLLLPLPLSSFAPVESLGIPLAPGAVGMPETEDFLISSLCVVKSPLGGTAGDCWAFSSSAGATGDLATTSGSRSSSSIGTRATSWSSTSELGPEEAPRSRAFSPSSSSMGSFSSPAPTSFAPSFAALAKVMDLSSSSNCFNSSASSLNSSDVNADCERTSSTLLFSSSPIAVVFSSSLTSVAVTAAVVASAASPANAASLSSRSTSSVPAASPSPAASPAAAASPPSTPSANVAVAVVVAAAASPAGGSTSVTGIEADDSTAFSATVDGSTNSNISVSAAGTVADLSPSFSASSSSPSFFFASTLEASS